MKKLRLLLIVAGALTISMNVFAAEPKLPACNDMLKITDSLDAVSDVVKAKGKIEGGSEVSGDLDAATNELSKIALATNNGDLGSGVKELSKAKKEGDWTKFKAALGKVVSAFDKIYRKACT